MTIQCDYCGKFISYQDIADGKAINELDTPQSDMTEETYLRVCPKCVPQYQKILADAVAVIYGTDKVKF